MNIQCPACKQIAEIPFDAQDGQHIRCPFCNAKFRYLGSVVIPEANVSQPSSVSVAGNCRNEIIGRFRQTMTSAKYWCVGVAVVLLLSCLGLCCIGHICETPIEKARREFREVEAKTNHYICSEELDVDLASPASDDGVYGLRWGERPRSKKHKVPCSVDYPISHGLYSRMKLMYGEDNGLCAVELHGPQRISVPGYDELPSNMRAGLQQQFVEQMCVPVFKAMQQVAEQVLQQPLRCFRGPIQLTGMTGGESRFLGVIRMDIRGPGLKNGDKSDKNPEQIFLVMKKR